MVYVDIGESTGKAYNLSHKMARESQHGIYDSDPIAFGNAFRDTLDFAKHANKIESPFRESTQVYIPINLHMLINKEKPEIASNAHFYFFGAADAANVLYIAYITVSKLLYWYLKGMKSQ